jgi:hypothetical protein
MSETWPPTCPHGKAFALRPPGEKYGAARSGHANAISRHRAFQELHGVVDRQRGRHGPAGAADVKVNLLRAVFVLQVQKLHHDFHGAHVIDDAGQEDDPILKQQIAQGHLPLAGVIAIALDLWVQGPDRIGFFHSGS